MQLQTIVPLMRTIVQCSHGKILKHLAQKESGILIHKMLLGKNKMPSNEPMHVLKKDRAT